VVLSAKRQGERVILGGHSLGASLTVAYASWDFDGHPGYEDLDGLVLIDGGLLGSFSTPDLAATKKAIKALDANGPFVDLLGLKLPWAAGVFGEAGGVATLKEPTAPAIAQAFPLLPAQFKPPIPATNRGLSATRSMPRPRPRRSRSSTSRPGASDPTATGSTAR
jgi:pimeloyl-ACP methyl ester carboxylesterase